MRSHKRVFPIERMAKLLHVSKSGYYSHIKHSTSNREQKSQELLDKIKQVYSEGRGVYGSPRIHKELQKKGEECSRKRVAKLMKKHGIRAKTNRQWKKRKRPILWAAPNLLNQNFNVSKPDEVWVSDITYVKTTDGWLYVATVLDLFSKKVIGLSMNKQMQVDLVKGALGQAILTRRPKEGVIHHSGRGSQYTSEEFRKAAEDAGIILSMNSGSCYDNSVAESLFHTIKTEHVYLNDLSNREKTKNDLFEFIEVFYNRKRSHSTLGYISPIEFEKKYFEKQCLIS